VFGVAQTGSHLNHLVGVRGSILVVVVLSLAVFNATHVYCVGSDNNLWFHNGVGWSQLSRRWLITKISVASDVVYGGIRVTTGALMQWVAGSWVE